MENRGIRTIAIVALLLGVVGISVAFAALSQNLVVNGAGKISGSNWDINFSAATGTPTGNATMGDITGIGTPTLGFPNMELILPGDSITYLFTATNSGDIDAKLSALPTLSGVLNAAANDVSATLTYSDDSAIAAGDILNHGESVELKVVVTFSSDVTEVPEEAIPFTLGLTLPYVQK